MGEFFNQSKRGPQDPLIGARGLTPAAQEVGANQAGLVSGRSIGWQTSLRRQESDYSLISPLSFASSIR